MKILLVVPPEGQYVEASANSRLDKKREPRPRLGILYVATYLRKCHPEIDLKVLDCPSENIDFMQYEAFLRELKPDLVGITALTFTIVNALKTARLTKEATPRTLVCIGGFHSTLFPRETLQQMGVDFVVVGEGEVTFEHLVRELRQDRPKVENVFGLGFRTNSGPIINPPRPLIDDLNSLPFPDYHLVDINKYAHVLGKSKITISLQSSRGCPFGCTFCDIRRTSFRFRSAGSVVKEICHWYEEGISSFFMVDDNFVLRRDRVLDICNQLQEREVKLDFKISARVNTLDRELLIALKNAGCSRINFGVESGHQKHLDYIEKGITPHQTEEAFRLCHEVGIEAFAYMIIGFPNETREEMYEELHFLRTIKADYATFAACSPYPKTMLYQRLLEDESIKHDYWQEFAENPTEEFVMPLVPGFYSSEELRDIQADLNRRFYLSIRIILKQIANIRSLNQLWNILTVGWKILYPFNIWSICVKTAKRSFPLPFL